MERLTQNPNKPVFWRRKAMAISIDQSCQICFKGCGNIESFSDLNEKSVDIWKVFNRDSKH
ncbi:hypothetical protein [Lactiplantibacillus pentosus]|uniref:hypothetical protein n=1 Tax=Lactiplantibacillus pentosus TaxID=1589 RepID=UPI0021821D90|nr:hypothetical protein [Lactiplantibacillus pentosus]